MPQFKLMVARFPFLGVEHPDVGTYFAQLMHKAKSDPRISDVGFTVIDTTPITGGRNDAVERAKRAKADFLLMIDNDMRPDLPRPGAKPFFESSLDFLLTQDRPGMVGAPYCGPPPHENVYVFLWKAFQSQNPAPGYRLDMYDREHAAMLSGIQECAALPTGLILIDMRCFDRMKQPYFDYEWKGDGAQCPHCGQNKPGPRAERASTEDVYFSRNAAMAGCKLWCNWDAWAGHHKRKLVTDPVGITADQVHRDFAEAVRRGFRSDERIIHFESPLLKGELDEPDFGRLIGKAREEGKQFAEAGRHMNGFTDAQEGE